MRLVRPALLLLPFVLVATMAPADATVGDLGHDVSYPQCTTGSLPTTGTFGIVGVENGLPFSTNPCLAAEAAWAVGTGQPALYTNTANPGHTSPNWPTGGTGHCVNATVDTDAGCAYDYGRKAAADAWGRATTGLTGTGLDPQAVTWWLDVEGSRTPSPNGNSWVGSGVANAADLQGFVDELRSRGVPDVGIYSTTYQWNDITVWSTTAGGYRTSTSSAFRASWPFVPLYPIEDGPVWFAGVGTLTQATSTCGTAAFTGGQRLLAQYADSSFDGDRRCADPDVVRPPTATMTAPTSVVTTAASISAAWTGADNPGGSGRSTYDVQYERAPYNGAFSAWQGPVSLQRVAVQSAGISPYGQGWTTCLRVRTRDVAGNVSASWSGARCSARPLDDRALTASTGWTRATGSGYFASTYTSTARLGATLKKTGLVTTRLLLLAQRCSTCGKVGVYVGSTLLATVDLHATSSYLAVIALPRFTLRTTTVTLKVLTSGKPVRIDGLATLRV